MLKEKLEQIKKVLDLKGINSTLYPPSTKKEIYEFSTNRIGVPKEYREFLLEYNGWRNFWNGFHLVGTRNFEEEQNHIVKVEYNALQKAEEFYKIDLDNEKDIRNWEVRTVQYYFPHYFVFATDMKDRIIFFNQHNLDENGNEEVVVWHQVEGFIDSFSNFESFLDYVLKDTEVTI